MTRKDTIAAIHERLEKAPDDIIRAVARLLEAAAGRDTSVVLPRALTPRELALVEQSKVDFRNGDTFSPAELRAFLEAAATERARARRS